MLSVGGTLAVTFIQSFNHKVILDSVGFAGHTGICHWLGQAPPPHASLWMASASAGLRVCGRAEDRVQAMTCCFTGTEWVTSEDTFPVTKSFYITVQTNRGSNSARRVRQDVDYKDRANLPLTISGQTRGAMPTLTAAGGIDWPDVSFLSGAAITI